MCVFVCELEAGTDQGLARVCMCLEVRVRWRVPEARASPRLKRTAPARHTLGLHPHQHCYNVSYGAMIFLFLHLLTWCYS